ncbi:MAG TPA: dihydrodipicolinate synthase family protein [Phycisphaerae bacterium]|nr:dihydrodipicolinate synthase family protein [Phycisphaerae bacterium]
MSKVNFITAIGTPLTDDEQLHTEGLGIQLQDQWNHRIGGILVAGTMGMMQLLTDETYRRLVETSVNVSKGRGEVLVGVGDAGFARSRDRIRFLNDFPIDGVAVLAPYFMNFSQAQMIEYFCALADESRAPLYLYDIPRLVGVALETETIVELAKHPNINGIKCSGPLWMTRRWLDMLGDSFRIIIADVYSIDMLVRHGVPELLDGMWAAAPGWTVGVADCSSEEDWAGATENTRKVSSLKDTLLVNGFGAFTVWMNARGIPGNFAPRPFTKITGEQHEKLLADPIVQQLIKEDPVKLD